ncbi:LysR substrate-binding domain-containing protein [Pseudomonas sp. LB-090624]|uniref:LysR substrate-binding domain-containing protein n=1 Tax=Pseudomonas sp. LB-090624 TaxID=2213079 RepID=UPI003531D888
MVVALPPRHPLLVHKRVPLAELAACPLVLFHPELQSGLHQQISSLLSGAGSSLVVAAQAASQEMLISLVAAGYTVGLSCTAQLKTYNIEDRMPMDRSGFGWNEKRRRSV